MNQIIHNRASDEMGNTLLSPGISKSVERRHRHNYLIQHDLNLNVYLWGH